MKMTRILIVDEDTDVLRLLRIKLSRAGYTVSRARDGQEALAAVASEAPDIVVTELLLPDMDGIDLIAQLRDAESPPLVMGLSGRVTDEAISSALAAGAADYVTKPFSPQGLLERLRVNLIRATLAVNIGQEA